MSDRANKRRFRSRRLIQGLAAIQVIGNVVEFDHHGILSSPKGNEQQENDAYSFSRARLA